MHTRSTVTTSAMVAGLVLGLSGCFESSDSKAADSGAEACLAKVAESPCDLLSAEILNQFAMAGTEPMPEKIAGQNLCRARWEGGRERTFNVAGQKITAPVSDDLMVGSIAKLADDEAMAARTFSARRSTPSQAKKDEMTAATQERVKDKVDDKHRAMANDFAARLMNSIEFEPVADLGDAAAWGGAGKSKQLWVRLGRYEMTMRLERSNDQDQIKQDNIELARALIGECS